MQQLKSNNYSTKLGTKILLNWTLDKNDSLNNWNEVCAWAIEQFGLPGDKYRFHPKSQGMEFIFEDEKDAIHMLLRWQ